MIFSVILFAFSDFKPAYAQSTNTDYGSIFDQLNDDNDISSFEALRPNLSSNLMLACRPFGAMADSCKSTCLSYKSFVDAGNVEAIKFASKDIAFGFEPTSKANNRASIIEPNVNDGKDQWGDMQPIITARGVTSVCAKAGQLNLTKTASKVVSEIRQNPALKNDGEANYVAAIVNQTYGSGEQFPSLLLNSAENDHVKGMYFQGQLDFNNGKKKEGFVWLNKAAEKGHIKSTQFLKRNYGYDFKPENVNSPNVLPTQQSSILPQTAVVAAPSFPSVMAKDYWTINNPTWVLDSSGNFVSSLKFGIPVTTYGERDGLGKVDLTKDKWVKLSDLSTSKPIARTVTSNAAITSQPVKTMPSTPSYSSAKKLHVPSDPNADYFLLEALPLGNNLSVVTRRIGPSGESFSKREIDCKTTKFRYLGDGDTIEQMNAPYNVESMRLAKKGDLYTKMSYDILKDICGATNASAAKPIVPKKALEDNLKLVRYVKGDSLNYRDAPTLKGKKLGSLPFAAKITIYERSGDWVRITLASQPQEWVHEAYVVSSKPHENSTSSSNQRNTRLSDAECGRLRIEKITTVKTQAQFDAIERQLTRGGCNSQRDARRKQWDWVRE